jgi:CheY-like chemotaxis protein
MVQINVLIVDDCSVTRDVIARVLRLTGLELGNVYHAPDGEKGLEILGRQPVELLLLDINMPVMDGREMLRRIRSHISGADLPVIIISSESNRQQIRLLEDQNAGFVHKPFTVEQLAGAVRKLIGACHEQ